MVPIITCFLALCINLSLMLIKKAFCSGFYYTSVRELVFASPLCESNYSVKLSVLKITFS